MKTTSTVTKINIVSTSVANMDLMFPCCTEVDIRVAFFRQ
ncbi:hypothetical protein ACSV5M_19070 [Cellvibrio sp. ARAG 10.3]